MGFTKIMLFHYNPNKLWFLCSWGSSFHNGRNNCSEALYTLKRLADLQKNYSEKVYTVFAMLLIFHASCHLMEIMTTGTCVYLGFSPLKIHLAFSFSLGQNHIKWAKDGINTLYILLRSLSLHCSFAEEKENKPFFVLLLRLNMPKWRCVSLFRNYFSSKIFFPSFSASFTLLIFQFYL